jgi:site-specific DNA-methyltransferase (adenine-specific)
MIKLLHGDCLELMKSIPDGSIDAIITDPPYGTTACKWDSVIPFEPMWAELKRIIKPNGAIVLFGSEPFSSYLRLSNIKQYKYDLYWQKQKPVNFLQLKRRFGKTTENIIVFYSKQCTYNPQKTTVNDSKRVKNKIQKGKGNSITSAIGFIARDYQDDGTRYPIDILKFKRVDESKIIHPTQKPVSLLEYLVKTYTNENETVLDFTMGSGTTGVACKNLNRNFIGIELDKNYFNIAKERIGD